MLAENARWVQPEQHRHHHQVASAERTVEPVGIAQANRQPKKAGKLDVESLAASLSNATPGVFGAFRGPNNLEFATVASIIASMRNAKIHAVRLDASP